jgi:PhoPQ-activated pathogenicity-related protein
MLKNRVWIAALAAPLLWSAKALADMKGYVSKNDPTYKYEIVSQEKVDGGKHYVIKLTSQTWRGIVWWHWMDVVVPDDLKHPETALLLVDGGHNDKPDTPPAKMKGVEGQVLTRVAATTGTAAARVGQVPNEPLFDGKVEDQIISYTYDQYLKSGEEDWPLLFPMVKSAAAAMTTVQDLVKKERQAEVKGFVVTGGSKRGWTSWLSAVADERVKAIAPFVIDTLNMPEQAKHQFAAYGGFSTEVQDYTDLKLQERMATPQGEKLTSMVDPYAYRDQITLPKLIVLGANDPYWTVDSANLYFPGLKGEKHLYYQDNTPHGTNIGGVSTLNNFYNCIVTGQKFPNVEWKQPDLGTLDVAWDRDDGHALLWTAQSANRDFRDSKWTSTPLEGKRKATAKVENPATGWTAYYVEVRFPGLMGLEFGSTTKMTVIPDTMPTKNRAYDKKPAAAGEAETKQ